MRKRGPSGLLGRDKIAIEKTNLVLQIADLKEKLALLTNPLLEPPIRLQPGGGPYLPDMYKFEFCLPTTGKAVPAGPGWLHEIKYDGYRLRLERDGDHVRLITKGGHDGPADTRGSSTRRAGSGRSNSSSEIGVEMTLQAERLKVAAPMLPKNNPWLRYFG